LFAEVVTRSLTIFVDNGNLMKKMAFPRVCLPIIIAGSSLVNNLLLLVTAVGVFVLIGHSPSMAMLWLPLLIGINLAFALGLGLILGVLNVFVRDVAQFMMVVLQLLFWLTPIVYMPSIIPDRLRALLEFNPMAHMVIAFQDVLLYGRAPSITGLAVIAATATVLLLFSLILFRRSAPEMVDVL
ncbi:UNVERIFIED_ORG: ABC transporter, partial [Rhodanobacter sp. FW104-R5]